MGKLSSGYINRAAHAPWQVTNNYLEDRKSLINAKFEDGILHFHKRSEANERKPKLVS